MPVRRVLLLLLQLMLLVGMAREADSQTTDLQAWLSDYNRDFALAKGKVAITRFEYESNVSENSSADYTVAKTELQEFLLAKAREAKNLNWKTLQDPVALRQFRLLTDIGTDALEDEETQNKITSLKEEMIQIYQESNVTVKDGKVLQIGKGLEDFFKDSRDYDQLLEAWLKWRQASGARVKSKYTEYIEANNRAIRAANYSDLGAYWRSKYETEHFREEMEAVLQQLLPTYKLIHAYTRGHLKKLYGADKFPASGHIPAHILGNIWAQDWGNLWEELKPPTTEQNLDISKTMKEKGVTGRRIYDLVDAFHLSMGFDPLPDSFWTQSWFSKPKDRKVKCSSRSFDFMNGQDFRLKDCSGSDMSDFLDAYYEMTGYLRYYVEYRHQLPIFRDVPNDAFDQAIGRAILLTARSPRYLARIGLLEGPPEVYVTRPDYLLKLALKSYVFMPFGYLVDIWRWDVYNGRITPKDYNNKWWELRCKYQGVFHPMYEWDDDAFDPGAKYHVVANTRYMQFFMIFVLQFQFHKALCEAANETELLQNCIIYNFTAAGQKLRNVMSLGASKPWKEAMKAITGQRGADASAVVEYFAPIARWLRRQTLGEDVGWEEACPTHPDKGNDASSMQAPRIALPLVAVGMAIFILS